MNKALIYDAIRTPRGRAKDSGGLHALTPQALLAQLYTALNDRTGFNVNQIGDVILGCATQHGEQAGNIAKTSTLYAGWPQWVPGMTINRYCSSGIDAVNDLMKDMPNVPVIFITAFPERLLTGEKHEPAFLISKPYKEAQVASAVSQAMFFASTETLLA